MAESLIGKLKKETKALETSYKKAIKQSGLGDQIKKLSDELKSISSRLRKLA